jgi:hypothetical protein
MAEPAIVKGTYVDIMVGDSATPEVFSILCGLTTRTFTETVNTNNNFVQDCADPEDVPQRRLAVTGIQRTLSGDGRYNRGQASLLRSLVGVRRNYRFVVSEPAGDGIDAGYYEGPAILTSRTIGGSAAESGNFASSSLTIESDGDWPWTDL